MASGETMALGTWMVGLIALSAIAFGGVAAHTAMTHPTGADPCVKPDAATNGVPPGPPSWLNQTAPHGPPSWLNASTPHGPPCWQTHP